MGVYMFAYAYVCVMCLYIHYICIYTHAILFSFILMCKLNRKVKYSDSLNSVKSTRFSDYTDRKSLFTEQEQK